MNWKIIGIHAFLLLMVGIASGIFEPQPTSFAPKAFLLFYLLNQCVLLLIYAAIFAHITYRAENHPFTHALLALLLSNEVASAAVAFLLSYLQAEPLPIRPFPLMVFEYTSSLVVLLAGIAAGVSLRRRKLLRSEGVGSASVNP